MTKPVMENQYRCECTCGEYIDTISSPDFEILFEQRETYPDSIKDRMNIQYTNHTPMDDYKIYEIQGKLVLAYEL